MILTERAPRDLSRASDVVAELRRRSTFVFVSHMKPDGDTLGAGLALGHALEAEGRRVHYLQQDVVPRNLRFMPGAERVTAIVPPDLPADTLWVFCDMSDASRAGDRLPDLCRENVLNVDHHLANSRFGTWNYVLETECSTGSCVLRLLDAMHATITPAIATCLLTTIMTDTGGYLHASTNASVLRASARLIDAGADQREITERIFANKRFGQLRVVGAALAEARLEFGGRFCWSVVDETMLARYGADGEDTEEIVGQLGAVDGAEAALLLKDFDGSLRGSLRSRGRINVQAVAGRLGGGGHLRAAGFSYDGTVAEAVEAVRTALVVEGL